MSTCIFHSVPSLPGASCGAIGPTARRQILINQPFFTALKRAFKQMVCRERVGLRPLAKV